jgi:hypothetical protein
MPDSQTRPAAAPVTPSPASSPFSAAAAPSKPAAQPAGQPVGIDRRDHLPYDEFIRDYVEKHRPVIISNAFPQWKAAGKWTPEYLKQKAGFRKVLVDGQEITLAEHLDNCVASTPEKPSAYMREQVIRRVTPELAEDLSPFCEYALPNWLRGTYPVVGGLLNRASEVELFIGGAGARLLRRESELDGGSGYAAPGSKGVSGFADLHYDPTALPVMLMQVYGEKEWVLFSPADSPYLYANGTRLSTLANPDNPDLQRFPLYAKATPIRFVQQPGEAVYLPAFWWHATRMRTLSIAVSSTFASGPHWDGMIDDVIGNFFPNGKRGGTLVRNYLRAVARLRQLGGREVGSRPFHESSVRKVLRWGKRTLLKRG